MKEKIHVLIKLQDCDMRIADIVRKKNDAPIKIQEMEEKLEATLKTFQEDRNRLKSLNQEIRKFEQEIQDLDVKIEKSHFKLANIKSNKEYGAALKEIEDLKTAKSDLEDKTLQLMEDIENLEKGCQQNEKDKLELENKYEKDKKDLEESLVVLNQELKEFENQRMGFHQKADRELLNRYRLLKERRDGQAMSAVVKGICQTCHLEIPPQKFNELLKGESLMTCPYCNRIIYWGEDQQFQN